jgi:hypothetical protein
LGVQVLAVRNFVRFAARAGLSDQALLKAADEIRRGIWDADLGGGLVKKRMARPGGGKRGGFRVIVAWRQSNGKRGLLVFLLGFAKNDADTLTRAGHEGLKRVAAIYMNATPAGIATLMANGAAMEIKDHE